MAETLFTVAREVSVYAHDHMHAASKAADIMAMPAAYVVTVATNGLNLQRFYIENPKATITPIPRIGERRKKK